MLMPSGTILACHYRTKAIRSLEDGSRLSLSSRVQSLVKAAAAAAKPFSLHYLLLLGRFAQETATLRLKNFIYSRLPPVSSFVAYLLQSLIHRGILTCGLKQLGWVPGGWILALLAPDGWWGFPSMFSAPKFWAPFQLRRQSPMMQAVELLNEPSLWMSVDVCGIRLPKKNENMKDG